jgi:surface polysaccharide O-acyltransferase-like enzyme
MNMDVPSRSHSGVECFRVVAIFVIIMFHVHFLARHHDLPSRYLHLIIDQGFRWSIPFFFIIAGYFWGKKVRTDNHELFKVSLQYGTRLFRIWAFWNLIYLLIPDDIEAFTKYGISALVKVPFWRISELLKSPEEFFFVGSSYHLWFFISLLLAVCLTTIILRFCKEKWLLLMGVTLYVVGLIAGPWAVTPIGVNIPFNSKHGPFFSTIFFIIGWYLSSGKYVLSSKTIWALIVGSFALYFLETYLLWSQFGGAPTSHSFLLASLPLGTGVSMLVLSKPNLGKETIIPRLGKYALGVYVVHYVFVDLFQPILIKSVSHMWDFVFPIVVFLLSLLTIIILKKSKLLKQFVE